MSKAAADPLIGATIDRYHVERQIGAGGMGRVYLARQPEIGARVAIKVVNAVDAADREEWSRRLFAEARAVNLISHENIVNVLDMVRLPDGRPALVMEYLHGVSLDRLIHESDSDLPLGIVGDVGVDVLSAIGAAHRAGILHRDLKPANVFVTPEGRAKVLDFGIAKSMRGGGLKNSLMTQAGRVLGTAVYMAPEQARGESIDERADLFAVGLILYEAATRRRAFRGPALGQVLEQHRQPIKPASAHRPEITPELDAVINRALAPNPADRFASAGEMAGELRSACAALLRAGRAELTAALQATGRIELAPVRDQLADPAVVRTAVESARRASQASTNPIAAAPVDGASEKPAARFPKVAVPLGILAAAVVVLLVLRARGGEGSVAGPTPATPTDALAAPQTTIDAAAVTETIIGRYERGGEREAALRAARQLVDDAEVSAVGIAGAFTEEGFRLERATFSLFSPRRAAAGERPCAVIAEAANHTVTAEPVDRDCSGDAIQEAPRCSIRDVMARSWLAAGAEARGRDVELSFAGDSWRLAVAGLEPRAVDDRCGESARPRPTPRPKPRSPEPRPRAPSSDDVLNPFGR